jgi:hypothetical protein
MTAPAAMPATLGSAMQRLRLIAETRAAGASWADIGAGLKMSGKEAKRAVRLLDRDSRRQFLVASQAAPQEAAEG